MNRTLAVLGVVAILGTAFFAGQKSFGVSVGYEHAEVINAVTQCEPNEYIGGCKECKTCTGGFYQAGGCSYFKDTLCTLCTQIDHCAEATTTCNTQYDQECLKCDDGYYIDGQECKQCKACDDSHFVSEACTEVTDTVCSECSDCADGYFVAEVCKRQEGDIELNVECEMCATCDQGLFPSAECVTGDIHNEGVNTECSTCNSCEDGFWASETCDKDVKDTECNECATCEEGEYISTECERGDPFEDGIFQDDRTGQNTKCASCTVRGEDQWTVVPCNPAHTSDAVHKQCSSCRDGEYQFRECTERADAVCPICPNADDTLFLADPKYPSGLQYCKKDENTGEAKTLCHSEIDEQGNVVASASKCGRWEHLPMIRVAGKDVEMDADKCTHPHSDPNGKCGEWESFCEDGFIGQTCCYHKAARSCGSLTTRERSGKRNGYVQGHDFADFCRVLCDEFPDCMAFEIEAGVDGGTCHFKAAYTQKNGKWAGDDTTKECYSNTCRQNSYYTKDGQPMGTINYDPEL